MGDVSSYDWNDSKLLCDCTHLESEHVSGSVCTKCNCDCYSQWLLVKKHSEKYLGRLLLYSLKEDTKENKK